MIAGREPRRQHWLAYGLLGALAVVVFGSLIGEFLGIHGWFGSDGSVFGMQGFEYLDLGRFWQVPAHRGPGHLGHHPVPRAARQAAERVARQHALAVLLRRARDPGLLRGRPAGPLGGQLHGRRLLALHGRAPVGRGLPRALHHGDGGLHLRAARRGARARGADGDLPRHPALLGWRRHRHHAPPLLLRQRRGAHGAGRVLLSRGGDPADVPHRRGVDVPAARRPPGVEVRRRRSRTAGR